MGERRWWREGVLSTENLDAYRFQNRQKLIKSAWSAHEIPKLTTHQNLAIEIHDLLSGPMLICLPGDPGIIVETKVCLSI